MTTRRTLAALAVGLMGCSQATTATKPATPTPQPAGPAGAAQSPAGAPGGAPTAGAPASGPQKLRPFAEVTKDFKHQKGFVDIYEKDGKVLLAIPKSELGKDLGLSWQIAQGIGSRFVNGGLMLNYEEMPLVTLEKRNEQIHLVRKSAKFTAAPGTPEAKSLELSFGTSIMETTPIISVRPADSASVVDVTDWLLSDMAGMSERLRFVFAPRPGQPGRAVFDKKRSLVEYAKAFPQNLSIRTKLTYTPGEPIEINSVPDSRYVPIGLHWTLAKLPEVPMKPRLADDRMGFFITAQKDYSKKEDTWFVRYANRWRLECSEQKVGELCVPKKAITYYIDPTVPVEWRQSMMAGVTRWSEAFEAAGFKDAVKAEMLPEGADAEDIRYPTLRWNVNDEPVYGAIGPSIVDPRSGEVLDADILFEANMAQGFRWNWAIRTTAAQAFNQLFVDPSLDGNGMPEHAFLADAMTAHGHLIGTVLAAKGEIGPNDPVPMAVAEEAMTWVTMHEVGHTLALTHNFRSSSDTPLDKMHDREWTSKNGVFSSVMEYPVPNIATAGQAQGLYYNRGPGSSDAWQIAYGYTPDDAKAKEIARQGAQAGHAYGADFDADFPGDPLTTPNDLGGDPLAWGKQRAQMIRTLIPTLPSRTLSDNERYAKLTNGFNSLLNQYVQAVGISTKYIGGQHQYRDHVGDPNGRAPFVSVPKAKQQEALAFLTEYGFGEKAFEFPPEVLQKLGANRWAHWGQDITYNGRADFPLAEQVANAQRAMMMRVLHPMLFARMRDAEIKFGASQVLTIPEYLGSLTSAVWSEAASARNVTGMRRELQRSYVEYMRLLSIGEVPRLPADARSVARAQLASTKNRIDARLAAGGLDAYTRAHYAESSSRIARILDAQLEAR
jgi:hypothetical protein